MWLLINKYWLCKQEQQCLMGFKTMAMQNVLWLSSIRVQRNAQQKGSLKKIFVLQNVLYPDFLEYKNLGFWEMLLVVQINRGDVMNKEQI